MKELTSEQKYYLRHHIANPKVTVKHIAKSLNVDREVINVYLTKNYCLFEPYIKLRRELTG
jgi:predicted DNA-binding protein YlxM (UPF0122 family)